jgi:Leucine-rich repeat (LRR) protein
LGSNDIDTADHIGNLTELEYLHISHNDIDDISALSGCPDIIQIHMQTNDIEDITPLASMPKLRYVQARHNDIADLTPLLNNADFATGDMIYVNDNDLNCSTQSGIIDGIEARGATVHDNPCD